MELSSGQQLQWFAWRCRFGSSESSYRKNHQGMTYGNDMGFKLVPYFAIKSTHLSGFLVLLKYILQFYTLDRNC